MFHLVFVSHPSSVSAFLKKAQILGFHTLPAGCAPAPSLEPLRAWVCLLPLCITSLARELLYRALLAVPRVPGPFWYMKCTLLTMCAAHPLTLYPASKPGLGVTTVCIQLCEVLG